MANVTGENLFEFIKAVKNSSDQQEIWNCLKTTLSQYGVLFVNYAYGKNGTNILFSNMSDDWLKYYAEHYAASDRLVQHCTQEHQPLYMGASYFNGNAGFDAINASMMDDIGRQGATGAISVPVEARNSAIISADGIFFGLSERDSRDVIKRHGEEISLIMHSAHQFLSKHELRVGADIFATDQGRKLESRDLLTVREKDVLRFLALGFRPDRIAEKMDIQVATVNMHIAKARRRLGASNREQAIAIAINMRQLIV